MCTAAHILSIHFSKMCEAPQSCVEVIRQILQGCKQNQILSIHLLKIEKKNCGCKFYIFVTLYLAFRLAFLVYFFSQMV